MKKMFSILLLLMTAGLCFANKVSVPLDHTWKYNSGDVNVWNSSNFDDSGWKTINVPGYVSCKKNTITWLRKKVTVPVKLANEPVYLELAHCYGAYEVFIDGNYAGSKGSFGSRVNVRPVYNDTILIPAQAIKNGSFTIALRYWSPVESVRFTEPFNFINSEQNVKITYWRNLLGCRMYIIIAALCLFLGLYSITQFFTNRTNKQFFYYALSVFAVSIYFFDMGAEGLLLPFRVQRILGHMLLPISLSCLWLFFAFFNKGYLTKKIRIASYTIDGVVVVAYLATCSNFAVSEQMFTIMLGPVVFIMVYMVVNSVRAVFARQKELSVLLFALIIAISLATYDVVMQVTGHIPFVWLQGYSFFVIDVAVFITMSLRAAKNQANVEKLSVEAQDNAKNLEILFQNAQGLSQRVSNISGELNGSVEQVSNASSTSSDQVAGIEAAIIQQKRTLEQTTASVEKLLGSLDYTKKNIEKTVESVEESVAGTKALIDGFESVGVGINQAQGFAKSLDGMTEQSSLVMDSLSAAMTQMQEKSVEILSVTRIMDDFAERTNLLAMNASIEAAHAGVAGKGFAVVANEIKNLASQSSVQSKKISESIAEISGTIETSAELCEKVRKSLGQMREGAEETNRQITSASEGMRSQQEEGIKIKDQATAIAYYAENLKKSAMEQYSYSEQVKNSMNELDHAVKSVEDSSDAISSATTILARNVDELKGLAEKTESSAEELALMMRK